MKLQRQVFHSHTVPLGQIKSLYLLASFCKIARAFNTWCSCAQCTCRIEAIAMWAAPASSSTTTLSMILAIHCQECILSTCGSLAPLAFETIRSPQDNWKHHYDLEDMWCLLIFWLICFCALALMASDCHPLHFKIYPHWKTGKLLAHCKENLPWNVAKPVKNSDSMAMITQAKANIIFIQNLSGTWCRF